MLLLAAYPLIVGMFKSAIYQAQRLLMFLNHPELSLLNLPSLLATAV